MKLKYIIPAAIAAMTMLASCSENDTLELDNIKVSQSYITLPEKGGDVTVEITASEDWTFDIDFDVEKKKLDDEKGVVKYYVPTKQLDLKDNSSEDKSKYLRICVGDIGYNTMRMWQGVSAYSDYEGIVSPAYTILKPKGRVNAKFFAYLFKMPEVVFLFYRFSQGLVDDTRNLKYQNFKRISVSYPASAEEQTAIVSILETADKEIDLLTQEIEQEKQKKKALMQLLLTGIARV